LPKHVAIIMDGNGRWAQRRGLPRAAGHRAGVEALRRVVAACKDLGIEYLTVFAFSTENWKRPGEEVDALMSLAVEYFNREIDVLRARGVRIRVIGDMSGLPGPVREAATRAAQETAGNSTLNLTIALNYGGRMEICRAARELASAVKSGEMNPEDITEDVFASRLYAPDIPDPDLLIRPSGEMRISNFLLWQCAYTEMWFSSVLWPDFSAEHLKQAVEDFRRRQRRFGGLG